MPEKREELTTEGGLDVVAGRTRVEEITGRLKEAGIRVSLFIAADLEQTEESLRIGAHAVEYHTGGYAEARDEEAARAELERLRDAALLAEKLGLEPLAGHGLNYRNVGPVARIPQLQELNIGHAIVSRALLVGMGPAVREMVARIREAR